MILMAAPGVGGCGEEEPSPTGGVTSNSSSSSAIAMSGHSQNAAATVRPRSRSDWISACAHLQAERTNALTSLSAVPLDRGENVTLVSMAAIVSAMSDGASDGRLP